MMTDLKPSCNNNIENEKEEDSLIDSLWNEDSLYEQCTELLQQSQTHLMLREFSECINICQQGLNDCSRHSADR